MTETRETDGADGRLEDKWRKGHVMLWPREMQVKDKTKDFFSLYDLDKTQKRQRKGQKRRESRPEQKRKRTRAEEKKRSREDTEKDYSRPASKGDEGSHSWLRKKERKGVERQLLLENTLAHTRTHPLGQKEKQQRRHPHG